MASDVSGEMISVSVCFGGRGGCVSGCPGVRSPRGASIAPAGWYRWILAKQGFTGITVPEEYGGLGLGDLEAALVLEELGAVCLSTAVLCQLHLNGPPRAIANFGNAEQRERFLPRVAAGECLIGIGMTEPDAGSDAMSMRARIRREGDAWKLEAYKNM